jgi:hypothetical protein
MTPQKMQQRSAAVLNTNVRERFANLLCVLLTQSATSFLRQLLSWPVRDSRDSQSIQAFGSAALNGLRVDLVEQGQVCLLPRCCRSDSAKKLCPFSRIYDFNVEFSFVSPHFSCFTYCKQWTY